jgi:hypothetical protein
MPVDVDNHFMNATEDKAGTLCNAVISRNTVCLQTLCTKCPSSSAGFNAKDPGPTLNIKCPRYLKTDKLETADYFGTRGTEYLQAE